MAWAAATPTGETFTCRRCRVSKSLDEFYWDSARAGVYPYCKVCQRSESLARHYRKAAADPTYLRRKSLKQRYGMTLEAYEEMVEKQEGRCLICGELPPALFIDHDHATGKVRGLLCPRCNGALGVIETHPNLPGLFAYLGAR